MRAGASALTAGFCLAIALLAAGPRAHAQTIDGAETIALKNGETIEIQELYWVANCKSILRSMPEVEILDGPHGVTAAVKEAMVLPRRQHCANKVTGGTLTLSAKDIEDQSYTNMTIRITYKTHDGDRKFSEVLNVSLIP
jgi:hypothetical protein